jgi:hypothetical protein
MVVFAFGRSFWLNEQKKRWKNCRWKEEGRKNEVADKERGLIVVE